jgi:hypothetical protein
MTARPVPRRHWRSYGNDPLPSGERALHEPLRAFPSWFLRIVCDWPRRPSLRGPALPVRLQPGPGATRLIVGQPPGRFPVSRKRAPVVAFTIAASLMIAPAVAGTPIDLSADPPKAKIDSGPSLSLGRVGPDLCPGGFCERSRIATCITSSLQRAPAPSSRCQEFC